MGDSRSLRSCRLKAAKLINTVEHGETPNEGCVAVHVQCKRSRSSPATKGKVKKGKTESFKALPKSKPNIKNRSKENVPDIEDCLGLIVDFTEQEASSIRKCLLDWYLAKQRVLPWRLNQGAGTAQDDEDIRAYAVWVSEVMLQQTRVATVINYYNQWMERWPTVRHLAQASQEDINAMWAGLGYYRRARYLLEGAKQIVEKEGGVFPHALEHLRKVPGIGDYTAGAIASIAFKQAVPVVDGNVIRVLCRLKAISANPKVSATVKRLWKLAGQLVDPERPGDLNQALMELGATICTPTSPTCSSCPVAAHCKALAIVKSYESMDVQTIQSISTGHNAVETVPAPSVTDYPIKVFKAMPREDFAAVCVVEMSPENVSENLQEISGERNSFLLVKRPQEGLLAGLWEFPSVLLSGPNVSLNERKAAMDQYLNSSLRLEISQGASELILRKAVGQYIHVFSHIRLHMYIEWMLVHMPGGLPAMQENKDPNATVVKWVDQKAINIMGLTSGVKKVYTMTQEFKNAQLTGKSMKKREKQQKLRFSKNCF